MEDNKNKNEKNPVEQTTGERSSLDDVINTHVNKPIPNYYRRLFKPSDTELREDIVKLRNEFYGNAKKDTLQYNDLKGFVDSIFLVSRLDCFDKDTLRYEFEFPLTSQLLFFNNFFQGKYDLSVVSHFRYAAILFEKGGYLSKAATCWSFVTIIYSYNKNNIDSELYELFCEKTYDSFIGAIEELKEKKDYTTLVEIVTEMGAVFDTTKPGGVDEIYEEEIKVGKQLLLDGYREENESLKKGMTPPIEKKGFWQKLFGS